MTPDAQFWMKWIVAVLAALGTVGAVIFALFGGWFRQRFAPPKLHLVLTNPRGFKVDPTYLTVRQGEQVQNIQTASRWYHVRLENRRRWSPATEAHLYLTNIEQPNAAGQYVSAWSGVIPMQVRYQGVVLTGRTVGPAIEFDLCSVVRGAFFELHPVIAPNNVQIRTNQPCRFRLTVQARSLEIDSAPLHVEIIWDGQWDDDTEHMANHLIVREF